MSYADLVDFNRHMYAAYRRMWGEHLHYFCQPRGRLCRTLEEQDAGARRYVSELLGLALSMLPVIRRKRPVLRVLDLCCGGGPVFEELCARRMRAAYYGVDLLEEHIARIKKVHRDLTEEEKEDYQEFRLFCCDAEAVMEDLACSYAGEFDLIICMDSFYEIHNKRSVLQKAEQLLACGGILIVSDVSVEERLSAQSEFRRAFSDRQACSEPLSFVVEEQGEVMEFATLLREAGLKAVGRRDRTEDLVGSYGAVAQNALEVSDDGEQAFVFACQYLSRVAAERKFQLWWWVAVKPSVLAQSVSDDGAVLARVVITDALWPSKWQHAFPLFEKGELEVKKGDYLCLVGRTGTGKSTLLLAIAGLLQWDVGKNLKCFRNTNVRIALVEQRPIVFEELSVRAGLRLVCACSADQSGDWATRVEDLLSQCDLAGLANQAMGTLSGGQRQRAAIALALGARPKILLLDEPMSSQDWLTREQLFEVLRDIRSSYPELAVIHVTHRWEDVVDVGLVTRVIELYCGEMFAASLSLK